MPEKGDVRINRVYELLEILRYINFTKMELISLTFVWFCYFNSCEHEIALTDNGTCGNGSLANSLGGASSTPSCVCYHSSEQLSIVVCCLHASSLQFTAVQQQKWAASRQEINSNILMCPCQWLLLLYSQ